MTDAPSATTPKAQPLAIIHMLGWTLGVAAVLSVYRIITDDADHPPELLWRLRLWQLGYGLFYGTAVSGMGLFLWRWIGGGPGPSQPGHWLLVLGGIGLVIDFGAGAVVFGFMALSGWEKPLLTFEGYQAQQILAWSLAALFGTVFIARMRSAKPLWTVVAVLILLAAILNASLATISLIYFFRGTFGAWIWQVPLLARLIATPIVAAAIIAAIVADGLSRERRDWLHYGGLAAALFLGAVELARNWTSLGL